MKDVLPGMQTADMENAEVEEEERLTAERGEKADQMELENEKRKEKVIKKKTLKERKGESERLEDLKTGEEPPAPATADAAATAGSVKAGEGKEKAAEKEGIKVFSLKERREEREQKRKEEEKQNPEEGPSGRKQKSDGANPEMGSGGEKADGKNRDKDEVL
ncbi:hypothetical protein CgunFtcFv8_002099 [Champsocephalus gunnari]|uniref:Uncharacterized protein n=2 Tax=Champsocephalus gunnari TaxID=52237 RepID=A0AAN8H824_CHAGU|nr:hypothetical protein CgunFtcFv8_002099 [Champsocephalus gunnari]